MKNQVKIILAILVAMILGINSHATSKYEKQKAVYHINYDDMQKQAGGLRNMQNHINALGAENVRIKVVIHGKGLSLILKPEQVKNTKLKVGNATKEFQSKITKLKKQGVEFLVCANTLKGKNIDFKKNLFDVKKSNIIPSGVAELTHLQMNGFAYIKP